MPFMTKPFLIEKIFTRVSARAYVPPPARHTRHVDLHNFFFANIKKIIFVLKCTYTIYFLDSINVSRD